jgi:mercuric ion binding protein
MGPKRTIGTLALVLVLSVAATALAQSKQLTVHVNGMVCQFCSQGIQKKFRAKPEVETVTVDMEKKEVRLVLKDGADLDDRVIAEAIRDAGVNVDRIER